MPSQARDSQQPLTEEQIRKATVGELKPLDAPIVLVEYDPAWPKLFAREAQRIRSLLGDRALQIEHIGSTSVPGLVAKPIIDILLVVASSADEQSYVSDLTEAGYRLTIREPDWHEHRLFKGPDTDINLHVFTAGSTEIERHLVMRDWLRTNSNDRELYADSKRKLATQKWKYVQNYADAKSVVINDIMTRVRNSQQPQAKPGSA